MGITLPELERPRSFVHDTIPADTPVRLAKNWRGVTAAPCGVKHENHTRRGAIQVRAGIIIWTAGREARGGGDRHRTENSAAITPRAIAFPRADVGRPRQRSMCRTAIPDRIPRCADSGRQAIETGDDFDEAHKHGRKSGGRLRMSAHFVPIHRDLVGSA